MKTVFFSAFLVICLMAFAIDNVMSVKLFKTGGLSKVNSESGSTKLSSLRRMKAVVISPPKKKGS